MKIVKVENCKSCPFLKSDRHYYCSKRFDSNPEAYRAGVYAEYESELPSIFAFCPLENAQND